MKKRRLLVLCGLLGVATAVYAARITDLPVATTSNSTDILVVVQGGTAKQSPRSLLDAAISAGSVNISGTPLANDIARFTDADTVEGVDYTTLKTALGLNLVENTALSTWPGTSNITTIGQSAVTAHQGAVDHDSLLNFVANEHLNFVDQSQALIDLAASGNLAIGGVAVIDDTAGATALQNIDSIDGTTEATLEAALKLQKCEAFSIQNPATDKNVTLFKTEDAITIQNVYAVVVGTSTPSATWNLKYGSSRNVIGNTVWTVDKTTTSVSTGDTFSTFDNASMGAGNWIVPTVTTASGTITELFGQVCFTHD